MLELKFKNPNQFRSIFEVIASILVDVEFIINDDSLKILQIDDARICLISVEMGKDEFDVFKISDGKKKKDIELKMALSSSSLLKILKRANSKDEITFKQEDSEEGILNIIFQKKGSTRSRRHNIKLIDDYEESSTNTSGLESMEFYNNVTIKNSILTSALQDAEIYDEYIKISVNSYDGKLGLMLSADGHVGDMEFDVEEEDLVESNIQGKISTLFSIDYLKKILKMTSIVSEYDLLFGSEEELESDIPIKFMFNKSASIYQFWIAPKVEDDSDYLLEDEDEDDYYDDDESDSEETDDE